MAILAQLVWLAVLAGAQESCRDQWQDDYPDRAGITQAQWNKMCDEGKEDPKDYFTDHYLKKESHDSAVAHDRALAAQFLGAENLKPEEKKALLEVDPENLEPAQRKAFVKWKHKALGLPEEDEKDSPPEGLDCSKPDKTQELTIRKLIVDGFKEIPWKQCRWLRHTLECDLNEITSRFRFRALYDCGTSRFRCYHNDGTVSLWVDGFYNDGFGTRSGIEGRAVMGIPDHKLISCSRRLWLEEFPIKYTSDGKELPSKRPEPVALP